MLMPAAVLVVMVLAAIAFDQALVYLGQRELYAAAEAAANDAVTYGLDARLLRETGEYRLDPARVEEVVAASLAARGIDASAPEPPEVVVTGPDSVLVRLHGRVDYVFARAVPGTPADVRVSATATATAVPS
jgi:hypothetical protein